METKISRSAPELELQRAVHCLKYADTSTLQLKNVYSFVLKLNDGLKSAIMGLRSTIRNLRKVEQERDYWKMRFEALQNRDENGSNWRLRYETLLERNVQLEDELRKIYSNEMALEEFHSNERMEANSPFFNSGTTTTNNGNRSNGGNIVVNQPSINQRRVNAIMSGNNDVENGDLNDDDEDDESDFEDDSEGAGAGGFMPMIEGPVVVSNSFTPSGFNPNNFLKIKCEVQDEDNDDPDEDEDEEEIEIKMNDYESNSNPADTSSSSHSNPNLNGLTNTSSINLSTMMMKGDMDSDVVPSMIDYEALRNCLAKDARQCPVCPRICSQRNSTVRHLIEVHHLDRSELMIRKFHKGYHFANFSK